MPENKQQLNTLLNSPLHVINVGLEEFAQNLKDRGVSVVHVDWSPPAGGNPKLAALLAKLSE
jgi:FdrA protein